MKEVEDKEEAGGDGHDKVEGYKITSRTQYGAMQATTNSISDVPVPVREHEESLAPDEADKE